MPPIMRTLRGRWILVRKIESAQNRNFNHFKVCGTESSVIVILKVHKTEVRKNEVRL